VGPAITTILDTLTRIMVIQPMTIRDMDIPATTTRPTTTATLAMWVAESVLGLTSTSSEDIESGEVEAAITVVAITVEAAITEADLTVEVAPTVAESLVAAAAAITTFVVNL
jgi:hypothetical protein